jgi:acyl-CoA thioesterase I
MIQPYLAATVQQLMLSYPTNRYVNLVFHGHSVPAGYFATPVVNTMAAYPQVLLQLLKQRFPFAVINAIVTAIGGENSEQGAARFAQVLTHRPDVLCLDYALNDRGIGLPRAKAAWSLMIEKALVLDAKVILLTPTLDIGVKLQPDSPDSLALQAHAQQIRDLALEYKVGLVDSYSVFSRQPHLENLLSWKNHPNEAGHQLVAAELLRFFVITQLGGES